MKEQNEKVKNTVQFEECDSSELNGDGWFIGGAVAGSAGVIIGTLVIT